MNQQVKYLILAILLIANLIYQCTYNFSLWNIFTSSLIIIILFYQFADIAQNKVSKFLTYVMMVVCLIEMYIGIKNNDWLLVYGFFGFLLFLLWVCLEPTLDMLARFFLRHNHFSIALKFANCSIFIFGKDPYILTVKGSALNMLKRCDEALISLEESQKLGYDHPFMQIQAIATTTWEIMKKHQITLNQRQKLILMNSDIYIVFPEYQQDQEIMMKLYVI